MAQLTVLQKLRLLDTQITSEQEEEKSKTPASIWIDANEITGYFSYFYVNAKSYQTGDSDITRSLDGKIINLNSYPTFLTPRLKIEFKYMKIETYRTIMRLLQSKNEFLVTCYDIVQDKMVSHNMYFQPEDYPEIFHHGLDVLAVINYTIELTGTNTELEGVDIIYHSNYPDGSDSTVGAGTTYAVNEEVIIGENVDFTYTGYALNNWNTKADGSGFTYLNNNVYTLTENVDLVLYAQWIDTNTYTLSYNYGFGSTYAPDGVPLYSKSITIGSTYGTLPNTDAPTVTYDGEEGIQPYTRKGWYKTPIIATGSTPITANTIYNTQANTTIYQIFEPKEYTITYVMNGANESYAPLTQKYNQPIYAPQTPTKKNYTFGGWYKDTKFEEEFTFSVMPPKNISIYAKWEQ